jgi:osmotically inducible protein OsmC
MGKVAITRIAHTNWTGALDDGAGTVFFDSSGIGAYPVTWTARAEQPGGKTSPEELIAGALSSCYSMALTHALSDRGTPAQSIDTQARVTFEPGAGITAIHLSVRVAVPDASSGTPDTRSPNVDPQTRSPNVGQDGTVGPQTRSPNAVPDEAQTRSPNVVPETRSPNVDPQTRSPNDAEPLLESELQVIAQQVKSACPVSQALAGVKITVDSAIGE